MRRIASGVAVRTFDAFAPDAGIEKVDLLKLDVEGHELAVLAGAINSLDRGVIRAIQFEFGGANIDSRTYFQDFWYLLRRSFRIYRILPTGLYEISRYSEHLEQFITTNYLAMALRR
jgi:hypothetical protein